LAAFLAREHIDAIVDATHPFASRMSANAVAACDVPSTKYAPAPKHVVDANGATEPTVARNVRPPDTWVFTASTARCNAIVIHSCRSMRSVSRPSWCAAARRPLSAM